MSPALWAVLVPAIAAFLFAAASYLKASEASGKISELHIEVNHRMDQLLNATQTSAHAAGSVECLLRKLGQFDLGAVGFMRVCSCAVLVLGIEPSQSDLARFLTS